MMTHFVFHFATIAALLLLLEPVFSRNISEIALTDTNILCYEATCNSTTNTSCLCSDTGYDDISNCFNINATGYSDYYTSLRLLNYDCDAPRPITTVDPDYLGTGIATFAVQTIFFMLRITARVIGVGNWGWDDHICVLAYITLIGQLIMNILLYHYGFYENYWTLDYWKMPYFWRIDFARGQVYAIGLGLCKASILFLYQRIFEGPRLRRVLAATQVFNALLTISYVVAACFVAVPFGCQFYLDVPADCAYHDVWDGSGAYSAVNAALDVWMVVIPAVVVWRLQMKTARKMSVIAIFATGILLLTSNSTCLVAIMRFVLFRIQKNPNLSDPVYMHVVWATYYAYYVELTTCFVIACLPASRQLLGQKVWPPFKSRLSTFSISAWTRSARSSRYRGSEHDPEGTKLVSVTISKPIEGSFRHLTSHLHPEESTSEQVGYAL